MNKQELLDELDTYLATRTVPNWDSPKRSFGDIEIYHIRGAALRVNDRVQEVDVDFYVYKRNLPQELAAYSGDPINAMWSDKIRDYIQVTNEWRGRIFRARKPSAICRILQDPAVGEKWVLIEETDPDWIANPPSVTDIVGEILTDI